jgi:hypothetical protein
MALGGLFATDSSQHTCCSGPYHRSRIFDDAEAGALRPDSHLGHDKPPGGKRDGPANRYEMEKPSPSAPPSHVCYRISDHVPLSTDNSRCSNPALFTIAKGGAPSALPRYVMSAFDALAVGLNTTTPRILRCPLPRPAASVKPKKGGGVDNRRRPQAGNGPNSPDPCFCRSIRRDRQR